MTSEQAAQLMTLHTKAVKAVGVMERLTYGTATQKKAIAAFYKDEEKFAAFVVTLTERSA